MHVLTFANSVVAGASRLQRRKVEGARKKEDGKDGKERDRLIEGRRRGEV